MISIIVATCSLANVACVDVDPQTCFKEHKCVEEFIPLTAQEMPSQGACYKMALTELAKVWHKRFDGRRLVYFKCGDVLDFSGRVKDI